MHSDCPPATVRTKAKDHPSILFLCRLVMLGFECILPTVSNRLLPRLMICVATHFRSPGLFSSCPTVAAATLRLTFIASRFHIPRRLYLVEQAYKLHHVPNATIVVFIPYYHKITMYTTSLDGQHHAPRAVASYPSSTLSHCQSDRRDMPNTIRNTTTLTPAHGTKPRDRKIGNPHDPVGLQYAKATVNQSDPNLATYKSRPQRAESISVSVISSIN